MEELGRSLPLSESIIEAEQAGESKESTVCLNCGELLNGLFCSKCGQKNIPRRQALGDLFMNFLGSFTSFDSKFFRTFQMLLFRPGKIIQEYNEGKREKYFHPARMYVFLSFIFFLIFVMIPDEEKLEMKDEKGRELTAEEKRKILDSTDINWGPNTGWFTDAKTIAEYDSIQQTLADDKRDNWFENYFTKKMIILQQRNESDKHLWQTFTENLTDNIPKMIFILLPIFALLLKLLYIRRDFYYSEHLVFSVFFYDFLFLVGIIGLLVSLVSWLEWLTGILVLLVFFYLYKAMRKVYGQGRFKTIVKFLFLNFVFVVCLTVAFTLNAIITLILL